MNTDKLTQSFKHLIGYAGVVTFISMITGVYTIIEPTTDLILQVLFSVGFIVMSFIDANYRKNEGLVHASGWWSLLGIAYPIAISIKEKSWNPIVCYTVLALAVPSLITVVIAMIVG